MSKLLATSREKQAKQKGKLFETVEKGLGNATFFRIAILLSEATIVNLDVCLRNMTIELFRTTYIVNLLFSPSRSD